METLGVMSSNLRIEVSLATNCSSYVNSGLAMAEVAVGVCCCCGCCCCCDEAVVVVWCCCCGVDDDDDEDVVVNCGLVP